MKKPKTDIREKVIEAAKNVRDPEIGIDLWTLGLVYEIKTDKENTMIKMTLTSPMCPFGPQIIEDFKLKLANLGINNVKIELVFDPPWQPSEDLRAMLGI